MSQVIKNLLLIAWYHINLVVRTTWIAVDSFQSNCHRQKLKIDAIYQQTLQISKQMAISAIFWPTGFHFFAPLEQIGATSLLAYLLSLYTSLFLREYLKQLFIISINSIYNDVYLTKYISVISSVVFFFL